MKVVFTSWWCAADSQSTLNHKYSTTALVQSYLTSLAIALVLRKDIYGHHCGNNAFVAWFLVM